MIKEYRIDGKDTGIGAFTDGVIIGHNPVRTETSKTGNHWTHVYHDVPENALMVTWGWLRSGEPWHVVTKVDGSHAGLTPEEALKIAEGVAGQPLA